MTDREQLCKEFTELTGGHWHEIVPSNKYGNPVCSCGREILLPDFIHLAINNCRYDNPADMLRVMMARKDFGDFMVIKIHNFHQDILKLLHGSERVRLQENIPISYIIEPDALLKAAVAFLKEGKK